MTAGLALQAERRLAAIMAADVVGFSRLMGRDEEGTLAHLNACRRETIDPAISAHRGRIVKLIGDGILAEFPSAVESVAAAISIQKGLSQYNANISESQRLQFRIGINLGDIVRQPDGEIYGDGINIAVRLENLADPGGIVIAENIREQLRGKLKPMLEPMSHQHLKNIEHPVAAWRVRVDAATTAQRLPLISRSKAIVIFAVILLLVIAGATFYRLIQLPAAPTANTSDTAPRLSIVVLPFSNLSDDPEKDYFADSITEDLTTQLSSIPGSFVIARSTAFVYRGKTVNIKMLGKDLGVRYVLEGSVRYLGNQVRVNAKLIDAGTGAQLWAETFDYERNNLARLQDLITARIARTFGIQIARSENERLARNGAGNLEAQDYLMRARAAVYRNFPNGDWVAVRRLFEQSLALDERLAPAWAGLAFSYFFEFLANQRNPEGLRLAADATERALALDPREPWALRVRGNLLMTQKKPHDALAVFEFAQTISHNDPSVLSGIGMSLILLGRPDDAIEFVLQAIKVSPQDPFLSLFEWQIGGAELLRGRYSEAVAWLRRAALRDPRGPRARLLLAAGLALIGDEAAAKMELAEHLAYHPGLTLKRFRAAEYSLVPAYLEMRQPIYDALRRAGLPED